jgi:hypothetical protein
MNKEQKDEIRTACATLAEAIISAVGNAKADPEPTDRKAAKTAWAAKAAEAVHNEIQRIVFQTSETWTGTADDLGRLILASPAATEESKELFRDRCWIGRRLAELSERFSDCYILRRGRNSNLWKLRAVKE